MFKHIYNIIKIFLYFLIEILGMLISPFVVGIALLLNRIEPKNDCLNSTSNPSTKFKDKWIDVIWGNDDDGLDGDIYYLKDHVNHKRNFYTRFNWLVLRNPVHNLGSLLGFKGKPKKLLGFRIGFKKSKCLSTCFIDNYTNCLDSKKDSTGFEYIEVIDVNNKSYPMYRLRFKYPFINYGIKANIGWKNWNVNETGKYYQYTFTVVVNPFKEFN